MERPRVSATLQVLPFGELSSADFERLCLRLVSSRAGYRDAQHLGAAGRDRGRDIVVRRFVEGRDELVYVQCKRVSSRPSLGTFREEIDKITRFVRDGSIDEPEVILFAVTWRLSGDLRAGVQRLGAAAGYRVELLGLSELDNEVSLRGEIAAAFFDFPSQRRGRGDGLPFERVTPRHLGPRRGGFVNRSAELAVLDAAAAARDGISPVLVLRGPHGAGKSRLAEEWAQRQKAAYFDGQLLLDFRALRDSPAGLVSEALRSSLEALGCPPKKVPERLEERQRLYRTVTAQRRLLLLLDHASEPAEVRALVPDAPDALVLVTSNSDMRVLEGEGAVQVPVTVLDSDHAQTMLHTLVGSSPDGPGEEQARDTILAYCAGLPLALELCATRIRDEGGGVYSWLAADLADEKTRLQRIGGPSESLDVIFATTYASLPPELARAYRLLGQAPRLSTWDQVAAVLEAEEYEARRLVALLASRQLVECNQIQGPAASLDVGMHDLLRVHARTVGLSEPAQESDELATRIARYAAARARQIDHAIAAERLRIELPGSPAPTTVPGTAPGTAPAPLEDGAQAARVFAVERHFLRAAQVIAEAAGEDTSVCTIADALWPAMSGRGYDREIASVVEPGVRAAERMGDLRALCRLRMLLARGLGFRGEHEKAMIQAVQAVELGHELGDDWLVASALEVQGILVLETQGPEKALPVFESSRARFPEAQDRGRAIQDLHIGICLSGVGRPAQAATAFTQALAAFERLGPSGDLVQMARTGWRLATVLLELGRREDAAAAATAAQRAAEASGEYVAQGRAMLVLAELNADPQTRTDQLRAALEAFTAAADEALIALALEQLAATTDEA